MKLNKYISGLFKFLFSLVVFCLALELGIRVVFSQKSIYSNTDKYTILVLGESTSAPHNKEDWPLQLNELLKNRDVHILNLATLATTTNKLLENLEESIIKYQPKLIISMMGVNDYSKFWPKEWIVTEDTFLHQLRVFKLAKYAYVKTVQSFTKILEPKLVIKPPIIVNIKESEQNIAELKKCSSKEFFCEETFEKINLQTKDLSNLQKSSYYQYLANSILPNGFQDYFYYKNIVHLYLIATQNDAVYSPFVAQQALHFVITSTSNQWKKTKDTDHEKRSKILEEQKKFCKQIIENAFRDKAYMNDTFLLRVSVCLESEPDYVNKVFLNAGSKYIFRHTSQEQPTYNNYLILRKIVEAKNICWIAMEYPTRDFSDYFKALDGSNASLIFKLSNKENFEKSLKKHNFDDIFTDKFANSFGHATKLGNSLIAENVYNFIEKLRSEEKCNLN
jgi:hypothetical protein